MEKSTKILLKIKSELESGVLGKSGNKFMSIPALCAKYNISYVTAANIIKRLLKDNYLVSIKHRNYILCGTYDRKSELYKKAAAKNKKLIGLHVRESNSPFFSELIQIISLELQEMGYQCIIIVSGNDKASQEEALKFFIELSCIGVFFITKDISETFYKKYPLPYVVFGHFSHDFGFTRIDTDNYESGKTAANYLISCGYKNFAYAGHPSLSAASDLRFNGYCDGLKEAGISISPNLLFWIGNNLTISDNMIGKALKQNIVCGELGIFCYHDLIAARILKICAENEISCPDEIGIIGYDDLSIAHANQLNITTFAYHYSQIASTAIEKLLHNIKCLSNTAGKTYIQTTLKIRGTTKKHPSNKMRF